MSAVHPRDVLPRLTSCFTVLTLFALSSCLPALATAAEPNTATLEVTVKWLPKPVENPDSAANDEKGMKPYAEKILPTDVKFDMVPIPGGTLQDGEPGHAKKDARTTKARRSRSSWNRSGWASAR